MTNEELKIELDKALKRIDDLESILGKNNWNVSIINVLKKILFKGDASFSNIATISSTGGTAPIADGAHQLTTAAGYYIIITTKNGIITNLT